MIVCQHADCVARPPILAHRKAAGGEGIGMELRLLLLDGVLQVPISPVHTPRLHAAAPTRLRPATDGPPEPRPCHSG